MCLILVGTWGRVGNVAYWDLTCGKQREAHREGGDCDRETGLLLSSKGPC